jgi:hypothetical protein
MLCKKSIPLVQTSGLSWMFSIWFAPSVNADDYSLELVARGPSLVRLTGARSSSESNRWDFTAFPSDTADLVPGRYWYAIRASNGLQIIDLDTGSFTARADLATAEGEIDLRTPDEIALDNINAVIAGRAKIDQQRYRINNRELYRESMTELLRLQRYYAGRVRASQMRAMKVNPFGRKIRIRLS